MAVVLLIVPILQTNVYAKQVVGQNGGSVDEFNKFDSSVPVNVKVLDQSNRYAVDLEYENMTVTFSDSLVWNVNTLKYELPQGYTVNNSFNIKVINHSDKAIAFSADAVAQNSVPIDISCVTDKNQWRVPGLVSGDTEKIRKINITATPKVSSTWIDVAMLVMNSQSTSIGTVTITIRPE